MYSNKNYFGNHGLPIKYNLINGTPTQDGYDHKGPGYAQPGWPLNPGNPGDPGKTLEKKLPLENPGNP